MVLVGLSWIRKQQHYLIAVCDARSLNIPEMVRMRALGAIVQYKLLRAIREIKLVLKLCQNIYGVNETKSPFLLAIIMISFIISFSCPRLNQKYTT